MPLGQAEIAALLGVKRATVETWRHRGIFPEPDAIISGFFPVWFWDRVEEWARATNRL